MEEAATAPFWKKAIAFLIYAILNGVIGIILLVIVGVNFEAFIPKGSPAILVLLMLSMLLAVPVTLWIRHRYIHAHERQAQQALAAEEARKAPPSAAEEAIGAIAKLVFIGAAVAAGLYVAFLAISALPLNVAIILGAVIIGVCILTRRSF